MLLALFVTPVASTWKVWTPLIQDKPRSIQPENLEIWLLEGKIKVGPTKWKVSFSLVSKTVSWPTLGPDWHFVCWPAICIASLLHTQVLIHTPRHQGSQSLCRKLHSRGSRGPGAPCPQDFFKIMQFSGKFKGKTPILSKFWVQGPPWGLNSAGPPPKSWICACYTQLNKHETILKKQILPSGICGPLLPFQSLNHLVPIGCSSEVGLTRQIPEISVSKTWKRNLPIHRM